MSLFKRKKIRKPWGFVVESGRMSSTGSSGATFIGHKSTRDVSAYRSSSGVGRKWNARDEHGRHWNGQRWVSHREWTIALRICAYADWAMLPWYKRIFVGKPQ